MNEIFIKRPKGATKNKRRVGRGLGSGRGTTAGKGNKGQNARSGGGVRPGFEGGQMPLFRRIARRGFSNYPFKIRYTTINVDDLQIFGDGEKVTKEILIKRGILKKRCGFVKLLGRGEMTKKVIVEIDKASGSAKEKISKAGGSVTELRTPKPVLKRKKMKKTKGEN
ncbi:MAG: 50S ribosomal protein L15 [Spirochaetales bacterium]|nr:50S ribosomal protein L15 [Spirochaetales bacterium]